MFSQRGARRATRCRVPSGREGGRCQPRPGNGPNRARATIRKATWRPPRSSSSMSTTGSRPTSAGSDAASVHDSSAASGIGDCSPSGSASCPHGSGPRRAHRRGCPGNRDRPLAGRQHRGARRVAVRVGRGGPRRHGQRAGARQRAVRGLGTAVGADVRSASALRRAGAGLREPRRVRPRRSHRACCRMEASSHCALRVECGFPGAVSSVEVAHDMLARILVASGIVDVQDVPRAWQCARSSAAQRLAVVTEAITVATGEAPRLKGHWVKGQWCHTEARRSGGPAGGRCCPPRRRLRVDHARARSCDAWLHARALRATAEVQAPRTRRTGLRHRGTQP